ncbi:MAG TPA: UV DNA damage repair endonuclease UvsE [Clostridia bacterium]|nr:UV DNA damage repair endonuclease UvsE [Clostridia bacterium]
MRIGYACLTVGVANTQLRACALKNANQTMLGELTRSNLAALDHMLDYNTQNGIQFLRVSSDIVPFASHPDVEFSWDKLFRDRLVSLGEKAREAGIRLSMHPGQYTVLNSPHEDVVNRAVMDLTYHCHFLDALGMGKECKIILHVGGAYGNKQAALKRFRDNYKMLDPSIRQRLVIENDDKIYNIDEVLQLGQTLSIPVVFDNLHNAVHPSGQEKQAREWIELCRKTWKTSDGSQKIHYSQQADGKRPGSHSDTISVRAFVSFASQLADGCDVMVEVKDKNLSAVKCLLATATRGKIEKLEEEWARYKYAVLERSSQNYGAIRLLLKDKTSYPVLEFYDLVEEAMRMSPDPGKAENAALHVWGYFKDKASAHEKRRFESLLNQYRNGSPTRLSLKRYLYKLAEKYHQAYLLQSLYFFER